MEIFDSVFLGNKNIAKDAHFFQENRIAFVVNCTKDVKNHFEGLSSIQKMIHKSRATTGDCSPSRNSSCSSSSYSSISDLSDDLSSIPSTPSRSSPQNSLPSTPNSSQKEVNPLKLDFAPENTEIVDSSSTMVIPPANNEEEHLLVQPVLLDEHTLHLHNEQIEQQQAPSTPIRSSSQSSTPSRKKDPSKYVPITYEFAKSVSYYSIKIDDSWEHDISKFFDHALDFITHAIAENKSSTSVSTCTSGTSLEELMELDNEGNSTDTINTTDPFENTPWKGLQGLPQLAVQNSQRVCVLVHCREGRSRSVSVMIAYAMKILKWTLKQAYEYLKLATRDHIRINDGFKRQLMEYEKQVLQVEENSMTFFGHRESKKRSRQSYCEMHEDDFNDEDYAHTENRKEKRRRRHKHHLPAASSIAALIQASTNNQSKSKQITLLSMFKKKEQKPQANAIVEPVKQVEEVDMDNSNDRTTTVSTVEMDHVQPQQKTVKVVEDATLKQSKKMKQTSIATFFKKK